jgi:hypothetical protein
VPTSFRRGWKGYRGGTAPYIWIADLTTLDIVKVPTPRRAIGIRCDREPRLLSLRSRRPVTLYAYDVGTRRESRCGQRRIRLLPAPRADPMELFSTASGR